MAASTTKETSFFFHRCGGAPFHRAVMLLGQTEQHLMKRKPVKHVGGSILLWEFLAARTHTNEGRMDPSEYQQIQNRNVM